MCVCFNGDKQTRSERHAQTLSVCFFLFHKKENCYTSKKIQCTENNPVFSLHTWWVSLYCLCVLVRKIKRNCSRLANISLQNGKKNISEKVLKPTFFFMRHGPIVYYKSIFVIGMRHNNKDPSHSRKIPSNTPFENKHSVSSYCPSQTCSDRAKQRCPETTMCLDAPRCNNITIIASAGIAMRFAAAYVHVFLLSALFNEQRQFQPSHP